jgi:Rrf2 family protein
MLKIAKSVEYAIFALKYINENPESECISTKEISETMNIPYDLLAKIMQKLVKNGMIESQQGTKGGYAMKALPESISISDIINALDQRIQFTDCMVENPSIEDCGRVEDCCIRNPLSRIQNKLNLLFSNTSLKEIIN